MYEKDWLLTRDRSPHSPHNIIPSLIPTGSSVLDIGCNSGMLGRALLGKKVIIDGVDLNIKALRIAKKFYREVYLRDLSTVKLGLREKKYDFIVLSDVLEHLPRPDLLLLGCRKYQSGDGKIIVSLPNVARLEIRLDLLAGRFNYHPGILGEDHLRFYTRETGRKLIESCGYVIESIIPTGLGHRFNLLPTLTAFQFIFVGRIGDLEAQDETKKV